MTQASPTVAPPAAPAAPKGPSNLALRILSAAVLLPGVIALLVAGGWWTRGLVVVAAVLALWEYGAIVAPRSWRSRAVLMVVGALATVCAMFVDNPISAVLVVQMSLIVMATGAVLVPGSNDLHDAFARACQLTFGVVYVGLGLSSVARLRDLGDAFGETAAPSLALLAFIATWANDTCAYFAGRAFGKHKMAEQISPKKTWEGFLGGALGTALILFGVRAAIPAVFGVLSSQDLLCVAVPTAFLGPVGDLAESMLKRAYDVKDSGNLIPGHGGILDRIDAVFFVAPWVLCYFVVVKPQLAALFHAG